ncbi:MAG: chondroitinase-B domain-containing protein, partial [Planctomycetota bacterium]|nr:chondroitinase-B domain-containing protein [Planctomycetota bacterium]
MRLLPSLTTVALLLAEVPLVAETVTVGPGQSLQEAADGLQPGDTLLLAEGTYYQSLELKRSGEAGKPITIKAAAPGKVVITGAMKTTPKFER